MPQLSGIYDSAPIQPIARIKDNLSILTLGKWEHYIIDYQEPLPPGPASQVEMVSASGATTIAANGTIQKRIVTVLQLDDLEFLHVRFEPLVPVEGLIWEQSGTEKFHAKNVHARVDRYTRQYDPYLATTTFFVLGINRDMNLEVRNPLGYALPIAPFQFWGYRMVLTAWDFTGISTSDLKALKAGNVETVRHYIGPTTWLPAEGRA